MAHWKHFLYKLRNFLQPRRAEREVGREISSHLEVAKRWSNSVHCYQVYRSTRTACNATRAGQEWE